MAMPSSLTDTHAPDPEDGWLESRQSINRIMNELVKTRAPLRIKLRGGEDAVTGLFLETGGGNAVLDELIPRETNQRIRRGDPISVRATVNDIRVFFETRISGIGKGGRAPYYRVPYPKRLHYPQRRGLYRATVPMQWHSAVVLQYPDLPLHGVLRDLSIGGFRARFDAGHEDVLTATGDAVGCELQMGDHDALEVQASICHVSELPRRAVQVGARFEFLSPVQEREIERWVADIARHEARLR